MPLTEEELESLREQLRGQVSHLPESQKAQALKQIDEMSFGKLRFSNSVNRIRWSDLGTSVSVVLKMVTTRIKKTKKTHTVGKAWTVDQQICVTFFICLSKHHNFAG